MNLLFKWVIWFEKLVGEQNVFTFAVSWPTRFLRNRTIGTLIKQLYLLLNDLVLNQIGFELLVLVLSAWHLLLDLLVVHPHVLNEIKLLGLMYLLESSFHLLLYLLVKLHLQLNGVPSILGNLLQLLLPILFSVHVWHGHSETSSITCSKLLRFFHPFRVLRKYCLQIDVEVAS